MCTDGTDKVWVSVEKRREYSYSSSSLELDTNEQPATNDQVTAGLEIDDWAFRLKQKGI